VVFLTSTLAASIAPKLARHPVPHLHRLPHQLRRRPPLRHQGPRRSQTRVAPTSARRAKPYNSTVRGRTQRYLAIVSNMPGTSIKTVFSATAPPSSRVTLVPT